MSMSSSHKPFDANLKMKIQQLKQDKFDQKHRMDELEEEVQHLSQLLSEQENELAQSRRDLADREHELQLRDEAMGDATATIDKLMRELEVARAMTARAEEAQRATEADQILHHLVEDAGSDDDDDRLRVELQRGAQSEQLNPSRVSDSEEEKRVMQDTAEMLSVGVQTEQQSSRQVRDLEEELALMTTTAEMLRTELQGSKDVRCQMKLQVQGDKETLEELKVANVSVVEEKEHWKEVANMRQELVVALQVRVKTSHAENKKLGHAIICCQRAADKRLQAIEIDRENFEVENGHLRAELAGVQQTFQAMRLKIREIEEGSGMEEELTRRVLQAQAHQEQLIHRIEKIEQKMVEADLAKREKVVSLERHGIVDLKRKDQDTCVSAQIQQLGASMLAHLNHLLALRGHHEYDSFSSSCSESGDDTYSDYGAGNAASNESKTSVPL